MPIVMSILSTVGIAAMLWVGGHILLVGLDDIGIHTFYDAVHHLEEDVEHALGAVGGVAAWLVNTLISERRGPTRPQPASSRSTARSIGPWIAVPLPIVAELDQRALDRLAVAVAVEDARVDVGGAGDRGRVAEVVGDLLDDPRDAALARVLAECGSSTTASETAASTVAPQVRKSLALTRRAAWRP